jgi:hypothetical protein
LRILGIIIEDIWKREANRREANSRMIDFSDPGFYLPVLLGVVAVVLAGFAVWRQRQDRKVSKATFDLLRTMRKEIQSTQLVPAQPGILSQQELRRRDALEWKKLKDVAKALGWVWDRMSDED